MHPVSTPHLGFTWLHSPGEDSTVVSTLPEVVPYLVGVLFTFHYVTLRCVTG